MTTPLRADFTNSSFTRDDHPDHHNDLATVVNDLDTRLSAVEEGGVGGGLPTRTTASYTTASLGAGASEQGTITMATSYRVLQIQTTAAARVRLYTTTTQRAADVSRAVGIDPASTAGVVLDFVTTAANGISAAADVNPEAIGASLAGTPTTAIPITMTPTAAGAVTVTLTYVPLEA